MPFFQKLNKIPCKSFDLFTGNRLCVLLSKCEKLALRLLNFTALFGRFCAVAFFLAEKLMCIQLCLIVFRLLLPANYCCWIFSRMRISPWWQFWSSRGNNKHYCVVTTNCRTRFFISGCFFLWCFIVNTYFFFFLQTWLHEWPPLCGFYQVVLKQSF